MPLSASTGCSSSSSFMFIATLYLFLIGHRLSIVTTMASVSPANYEGMYRLTELYDSDQQSSIDIPSLGDFLINITKVDTNQYQVGIKIGNNIGTRMTVTSSTPYDIASFGHVISTRMMPSPELWRIEVGINKVIDRSRDNSNDNNITTSIRLMSANSAGSKQQLLLIENTKGRIGCSRSTNSLEAGG